MCSYKVMLVLILLVHRCVKECHVKTNNMEDVLLGCFNCQLEESISGSSLLSEASAALYDTARLLAVFRNELIDEKLDLDGRNIH